MKIGIVSDSHGSAAILRRAIDELISRGSEAIVHCGDIGGDQCMALLAEAGVDVYAVAGNVDVGLRPPPGRGDGPSLHFDHESILVPLEQGAHLAATHGNRPDVLDRLVASGRFAYVCWGHTHAPEDERVGPTRVINPGALHHGGPLTAALLDTEADTVELVALG